MLWLILTVTWLRRLTTAIATIAEVKTLNTTLIRKGTNTMWTDAEIIEYYDSHWDLTLRELSRITGRSVPYLAKLLREE
jgi:hypothetical protein